jgi:hypothetical protein
MAKNIQLLNAAKQARLAASKSHHGFVFSNQQLADAA